MQIYKGSGDIMNPNEDHNEFRIKMSIFLSSGFFFFLLEKYYLKHMYIIVKSVLQANVYRKFIKTLSSNSCYRRITMT